MKDWSLDSFETSHKIGKSEIEYMVSLSFSKDVQLVLLDVLEQDDLLQSLTFVSNKRK